jgi:hypothetical protein
MMRKILIISLLVFLPVVFYAQNTVITDNDSYTAHNSAMLDVYSLSKGLLVPRLTSAQRTAIGSPADGLLVYDTNLDQYYYYGNSTWNPIDAPSLWSENADTIFITGSGKRYGVGTASPVAKLTVQGDATITSDDPLFEVKNSAGDVIFAVYENEVKVNFKEPVKGNKGGFAVGGITGVKGDDPTEYLRITPDSVRIYIDDTGTKGVKGGFAVGGVTGTKGGDEDYLVISRDSARIYVEDGSKGVKGGFAVGGVTGTKNGNNFLDLTVDNYFIGHQTGETITTGFRNSVMGYQSGQFLAGASYNVFLGFQAGNKTTEGDRNVFLGYQAGEMNTTGGDNTFIGTNAGFSNVDGGNNVFVGNRAGESNVSGDYNTIFGWYAGNENDADYNTFVGYKSGEDNTSGYRNTFLGYLSGEENTTGARNIFVGGFAGGANTTADDNTYVGYVTGRYSTGNGNTFLGYGAGLGVNGSSTGTYNTFVGYNAGNDYTTGSYNVAIGRNAAAGLTTQTYKLYIESRISAVSGQIPLIYGDFSSDYVVIDGLNNFSKTFYVNGAAGGSGSWNAKLDLNQKSNTKSIDNALDLISGLKGISYDYIDNDKTEKRLGIDPEALLQTIPEVITKHEDGSYSIQYAPLTSVLLEAIKEQQEEIELLKNQSNDIEKLKMENKELRELINQINQKLE